MPRLHSGQCIRFESGRAAVTNPPLGSDLEAQGDDFVAADKTSAGRAAAACLGAACTTIALAV